jgi:1-acyl-sn-glycerol-3-phosphate acyltransferase
VKKRLDRIWLRVFGWKTASGEPDEPSFGLIAAPASLTWDLPHMIAFAWLYGVQIAWLGKRQIFRWPFGGFFRALGGIPVVRERRTNMVDVMAKTVVDLEVTGRGPLGLVVPAEGTRRRAEHWKSGFYHIARKSGLPIVPSYLDYARGTGGFGPAIHPTGDIATDMEKIRAFYEGRQGRHPELFGPVRLAEEDAD